MSNVNNGGPPRDHQNDKTQSKMGVNASGTQSRLAPINTQLASAAKDSKQTATSSYTDSNGNSYSTTSYTPATSLYGSTIWSPIPANEVTQSATMPPKLTWENYMHQGANLSAQTQRGAAGTQPPVQMPQTNVPNAAIGLGLHFGEVPMTRDIRNGTTASPALAADNLAVTTSVADQTTRYSFKQRDIANPHLSPLAPSAANLNASTVPLMQHPFGTQRQAADQPRALRNSGIVESEHRGTTSQDAVLNGADNASTTDESFPPMSTLSDHPLIRYQERGGDGLIVAEDRNRLTWLYQMKWKHLGITEAWKDIHLRLGSMNSTHFRMDYGSRIICLKTDYVENVWWALKDSHAKWVMMEKVMPRLMRLWDGRKNPKEQVLLLISVNGHKAYCGLAEMRGPWTPGGDIADWVDPNVGSHTMGTFPITWISVKNVPYTRFTHIKHDYNGQPITNMWNGMHFPYEDGVKVMECFLEAPHYTNVLAWFDCLQYSPHKELEDMGPFGAPPPPDRFPQLYGIDPSSLGNGEMIPYNCGAGNGHRGPFHWPPQRLTGQGPMSANWRQQQNTGHVIGEVFDSNMTPTPGNRLGVLGGNMAGGPSNFDGPASPSPCPGQVMESKCLIDENGTVYIPATPHRQHHANMPMRRGGNPDMMPYHGGVPSHGYQPSHQPPPFFDNSRGRDNARGGRRRRRGGRGGRGGARGGRGTASTNASRDNHSPFIAPRSAHSPFNAPSDNHSKQATGSAPSPTEHRMGSGVGRASPSATAGNLRHAKTTANLAEQYKGTNVLDNNVRLQRAAPSANFVPESVIAQTDTSSSFVSTMANTSNALDRTADPSTPSSHKFHGKQVALQHPYAPMPPVEESPSQQKSLGTMMIMDNKSPGGCKLYPIPIDRNDYNDECADTVDLSFKTVDRATRVLQTDGTLGDEAKTNALDKIDTSIDRIKLGVAYARTTINYVPHPPSESGEVAADPRFVQAIQEIDWDKPYTSARESGNVLPVLGSDGQILKSISKNGDVEDMRERDQIDRRERYLYTGSFSSEVKGNVFGLVDTPPHSVANGRVEAWASELHGSGPSEVFSDCTGVGGGVPRP